MTRFRIRFSDRAQFEDLPKIDMSVRKSIATSIEEKLTMAPEMFGKPLRYGMRLLRVLRVGDWRVVFSVSNLTVHVLTIRHRKQGYDDLS